MGLKGNQRIHVGGSQLTICYFVNNELEDDLVYLSFSKGWTDDVIFWREKFLLDWSHNLVGCRLPPPNTCMT
jgi:hypothetical protein